MLIKVSSHQYYTGAVQLQAAKRVSMIPRYARDSFSVPEPIIESTIACDCRTGKYVTHFPALQKQQQQSITTSRTITYTPSYFSHSPVDI